MLAGRIGLLYRLTGFPNKSEEYFRKRTEALIVNFTAPGG